MSCSSDSSRRRPVCRHDAQQTRNGSNQYQHMIKCAGCGKVLAQVFNEVNKQVYSELPMTKEVVKDSTQMMEEKIRNLEEQLKTITTMYHALKEEAACSGDRKDTPPMGWLCLRRRS